MFCGAQAAVLGFGKNGGSGDGPADWIEEMFDYKRAVAMLAEKGDTSALWNGADAMLIQGATNLSPLLSGGAQPAQGAPQAAPQSAPASVPAKPLPPPERVFTGR